MALIWLPIPNSNLGSIKGISDPMIKGSGIGGDVTSGKGECGKGQVGLRGRVAPEAHCLLVMPRDYC